MGWFYKKDKQNFFDLEFLKESISEYSGKIVYTHKRSGICLNTKSNSLYLKKNTITFKKHIIPFNEGILKKTNLNYCYIRLENYVLENNIEYTTLVNKLMLNILELVTSSEIEKKNWYLEIDTAMNFMEYGLKTELVAKQLKKDILEFILNKISTYSTPNNHIIFNIEYDKQLNISDVLSKSFFTNFIVYYKDMDKFHHDKSVKDLIDMNFIIEYYFNYHYINKFRKLIYILSNILKIEDIGIDDSNQNGNISYYFLSKSSKFHYFKYRVIPKFFSSK